MKIIKNFDLNKKRPQVLLLGNGITYNPEVEWSKIIEKFAKDKDYINEYQDAPYPVQATIATDFEDVNRYNKYFEFFSKEYNYKHYDRLAEVLNLSFDAILTTNYTTCNQLSRSAPVLPVTASIHTRSSTDLWSVLGTYQLYTIS